MKMVNGVVLAGGRSGRMGRDKALIEILGVPLLLRQVEKLQTVLPEGQTMVSVREEGGLVLPDGVIYVHDEIADQGPVMGLYSCLKQLDEGYVFLLGVDLPRIDEEVIRELVSNLDPGVGVAPGYSDSDFFEPLSAVFPVEMLSMIEDYLQQGNRSFQKLIQQGIDAGLLKKHVIRSEQSRKFMNVNCPEDLVEFVK